MKQLHRASRGYGEIPIQQPSNSPTSDSFSLNWGALAQRWQGGLMRLRALSETRSLLKSGPNSGTRPISVTTRPGTLRAVREAIQNEPFAVQLSQAQGEQP